MSPTLRHSLARSTSETSSDNGAIAYLRVVETEAYADWESGYDPADRLDQAVVAARRAVFPLRGLLA